MVGSLRFVVHFGLCKPNPLKYGPLLGSLLGWPAGVGQDARAVLRTLAVVGLHSISGGPPMNCFVPGGQVSNQNRNWSQFQSVVETDPFINADK